MLFDNAVRYGENRTLTLITRYIEWLKYFFFNLLINNYAVICKGNESTCTQHRIVAIEKRFDFKIDPVDTQ